MATTKQKLTAELGERAKELDEQVVEYVASILDDSSHETTDDIVEAVCPFLHETGCLPSRESVRSVVEAVTGRAGESAPAGAPRPQLSKLAAPVTIAKTASDTQSEWAIYAKGREAPTYVNQEQLKKAEEKQKERQEKRAAKEAAKLDRRREKEGLSGQLFDYSGYIHQTPSSSSQDDGTGRDIRVDNLSVSFGKLDLLENTTLSINFGRRYGLVGRNGCGVSTQKLSTVLHFPLRFWVCFPRKVRC